MVKAQGGDVECIDNPDKFAKAPCTRSVKAQKSASHRYTVVSIDNGENRFGGISATRNGLRYTIIDTEDELTIDGEDVIKARKVY